MKKIRNMGTEWSYQGANGPAHWHTLCDWFAEGAKFPYQSPIELKAQWADPAADYQPLTVHYQSERFTEKAFKNTIHFVPFDTKSYVRFNEETYRLTDIHFHLPSEHVIEGQRRPLEFHLVHMNDQGANLVLGVLFELVEEPGKLFNELPDNVWDFENHQQWFDPSIFLPEKRSHFHYVGSLTTPPTKGPINWFVFDQVGRMNLSFLGALCEDIADNNARPLQERKERSIIYYDGQ